MCMRLYVKHVLCVYAGMTVCQYLHIFAGSGLDICVNIHYVHRHAPNTYFHALCLLASNMV